MDHCSPSDLCHSALFGDGKEPYKAGLMVLCWIEALQKMKKPHKASTGTALFIQ
jgi:hypothetical protein